MGLTEISLSFHHCGKKLKYVTLHQAQEKKSCCAGGEMEQHGCCDDKVAKYDVDDQTLAKVFKQNLSPLFLQVAGETPIVKNISYEAVFTPEELTDPPPLLSQLRLHILHCFYLI